MNSFIYKNLITVVEVKSRKKIFQYKCYLPQGDIDFLLKYHTNLKY